MSKKIIGLDFGTTFSFPAVEKNGTMKELVPTNFRYGIPSLFYFNSKKGIICGETANKLGELDYNNLVKSIKMKLKDNDFNLDGEIFTPKQIVKEIVKYILTIALQKMQSEYHEQTNLIVLAVPVGFSEEEKAFLKNSINEIEIEINGRLAPIKVVGLIEEPVAAAMHYLKECSFEESNPKILVYDLGGGTFDLAFVEHNSNYDSDPTSECIEPKYRVLDHDMLRIGGDLWDQRLKELLIQKFKKEHSVDITEYLRGEMFGKIMDCKHDLSIYNETGFHITVEGASYAVELTRQEFNEATNDLLQKTLDLTKKIIEENPNNTPDYIILVGGSSNMPQVKEGLKSLFPNIKIELHSPEHAIGFGAAYYASMLSVKLYSGDFVVENEEVLQNKAVYSYGAKLLKSGAEDEYIIINAIFKDDILPKKEKIAAQTRYDGQQQIKVCIYENTRTEEKFDFETMLSECTYIGDIVVDGLPEGRAKGQPLTIEISLNQSGLIEVKLEDNNTGKNAIVTMKHNLE